MIIAQIISSGVFILLYIAFLPQKTSIEEFIPIFILVNILAIIIYVIPILLVIKRSPVNKTDRLPPINLNIHNVVGKIGISFLFLISTKVIRIFPVSFIDMVTHPALISLALVITLLDVLKEFLNQGVNYLMITSDELTIKGYIPNLYIKLYIFLNIILFIFSNIILYSSTLVEISITVFGNYGIYLPYALAVFVYPKLILLVSSSLNEGYLMRFQYLKELTISRIVIGILVLLGLIFYFIYFNTLPPLILFIYLILSEFLVSFSSAIIGHDHFKSKKFLVIYLISMLIPLIFIIQLVS